MERGVVDVPCPGEGPCKVWPLDLACCLVTGALPDPCLNDGDPVPQVIVDQMKLAASQFLWRRTGMQFGCCQVVLRPTQNPDPCDDCGSDLMFGFPWIPRHLADGSWTNISCFCGQDPCGCAKDPCSIALPYPVCSIDEVKVDGIPLGKAQYRVDDFRKLVRTPGYSTFTQSMATAAGPVGGPIVAGLVTVTGGGSIFSTGDGVAFPNPPEGPFNVNFGAPRRDLSFLFEVPAGVSGSFNFFAAGGAYTVERVDGNLSTLTKVGQLITYGPPTDAGSVGHFRVNISDSGFMGDIAIQTTAGLGLGSNSLTLTSVSWSDPFAGAQCWPKCNDLSKPDTVTGTMSVTLTYGRPIPELVLLAANELACQLIKRCVGKPCDLPQRVHSINRQGMSATFLDPMEFLKDGMTGIFLVDLAIKTYNPYGLYKKAAVYSPDSIGKWTVTTWENKFGGREDAIGPECT